MRSTRCAVPSKAAAALVDEKRGPRGPHPNRVADEVEGAILAYSVDHPTHGQQRVAKEMRMKDLQVSQSGVRGVCLRHCSETRHKRLPRLERQLAGVPSRSSKSRSPCSRATA